VIRLLLQLLQLQLRRLRRLRRLRLQLQLLYLRLVWRQ